jgi:hypothetical protein
VQGAGYSKSEEKTDAASLELETNMDVCDQVVSQEISNQERYAAD